MGLRANGRRVPPGQDRTASIVSTSSHEKGVNTNDPLAEESSGMDVAPSEAETMKDDDWDQGPFYRKPKEVGQDEEGKEENNTPVKEKDAPSAFPKRRRTMEETNAEIRILHTRCSSFLFLTCFLAVG
jgi:hypothetical protein